MPYEPAKVPNADLCPFCDHYIQVKWDEEKGWYFVRHTDDQGGLCTGSGRMSPHSEKYRTDSILKGADPKKVIEASDIPAAADAWRHGKLANMASTRDDHQEAADYHTARANYFKSVPGYGHIVLDHQKAAEAHRTAMLPDGLGVMSQAQRTMLAQQASRMAHQNEIRFG